MIKLYYTLDKGYNIMKNILYIITLAAFVTLSASAQEIKEAPVISDSVISEIAEIEYNEPLLAITMPSEINNYTYVNVREDANTDAPILGMSEMYKNLLILGEKSDFYKVEVTCTDYGTKIGYIAKQFVKPYTNKGTGYINLNGEYDYSYTPLYRYPDSSSSRLIKLSPYSNLNILSTVGNWIYCEINGSYGFVNKSRITDGYYVHNQLNASQKAAAERILKDSIIFMPNDKTSVIKGKPLEVVQPVIKYFDKTMIPVKSLDTFWGAVLNWNGEEKSATVNISDTIFKFTNGQSTYLINGKKKDLGIEAFIRNDRLYVPIRTVSEDLGFNIYYFGEGMPFIAYKGKIDYNIARYIINSNNNCFSSNEMFEWPVPSSSGISSSFGDGRGHNGIDITAPAGTPIVACADGVVTEVYMECTHNYPKTEACCGGGYGNYVVIVHEHTIDNSVVYTRYSHIESTNLVVGQYVSKNEHIANVGCTGRSTGFHLDFELTIDNTKTDPATYIKVPANLYDSGSNGLYTKPYIDRLLSTQPTF